jgi:hypothetical protein
MCHLVVGGDYIRGSEYVNLRMGEHKDKYWYYCI